MGRKRRIKRRRGRKGIKIRLRGGKRYRRRKGDRYRIINGTRYLIRGGKRYRIVHGRSYLVNHRRVVRRRVVRRVTVRWGVTTNTYLSGYSKGQHKYSALKRALVECYKRGKTYRIVKGRKVLVRGGKGRKRRRNKRRGR